MIGRIFEVVNFLLLVAGLWWLYRRFRLWRLVDNYQARITEEITKARQLEAEAEELHRQAEAERAQAAARAREILENARALGERTVAEARAAAEAEAERLLAEARREAELERRRALAELRRAVVEEVIAQAQALVAREMNPERQRLLVESFFGRLRPEELQARLS